MMLGSLDSADRKLLFKSTTAALYAHPNHLLFMRGEDLVIQAFDTQRFELTGEPVRVVSHASASVRNNSGGGFGPGAFSASDNGVIAYRAASGPHPTASYGSVPTGRNSAPHYPPAITAIPRYHPTAAKSRLHGKILPMVSTIFRSWN
jgi:hypothetical protein